MKTRTCSKCGLEKTFDQFNFRNKTEGIRQQQCSNCTRLNSKRHYDENKSYYIKKARKENKKRWKELVALILTHLQQHPCADCGESDPVVLHFDHVRGKKIRCVSQMISRKWGWNKIQKEINKCEIRCANCHLRRTHKQLGWKTKGL